MQETRLDRVAGVVWSVYAHESGTDTAQAKLLQHAHCLRPALRALRHGQPLDDWALVELPPRTFYALLAGAEVLQAAPRLQHAGLIEVWCRYNDEALDTRDGPAIPSPGLPWARTRADHRNAAIVLRCGGLPELEAAAMELTAARHPYM